MSLEYSWTFNPTVHSERVYAIISAHNFTSSLPRNTTMYFGEIRYEVLEKPFDVQRLIYNVPVYSATIPVQSVLSVQPQSNCPHSRAGLKNWEDPATWGGSVPQEGSVVRIPDSTAVLITANSFASQQATFKEIFIPRGSELIFSDNPLTLKVETIWNEGTFRMGSDTCRLNSRIKFIFTGRRGEVPRGGKGIASTGPIEIFSYQYSPTWTRLAYTVREGDDRAFLAQPVNWEAEQQVVLVTSNYYDTNYNFNEILTIKSVVSNGIHSVVFFVEPARFYHHVCEEYQTEILLLSRRIEMTSEDHNDEFGGHVIVNGTGNYGRIAGVELSNMGQ